MPEPNDSKKLVEKVSQTVKDLLWDEPTSHDWWHVERVRKIAVKIAKREKADLLICELAALLHDVGYAKGGAKTFQDHLDHDDRSVKMAIEILSDLKFDPKLTSKIISAFAENLYHKLPLIDLSKKSLEWQVVFDADKLDAVGAISIARALTFGGYYKRPIYDPQIPLGREYKPGNIGESTLHHIEEKHLQIAKILFTKTAKQIAKKRRDYTKNFIKQFLSEWQGRL